MIPDPLSPKTPFDRLVGITVNHTMNASKIGQDTPEAPEPTAQSVVIPQEPLEAQPDAASRDPVPWLTPEIMARQQVWLEKTLMDLCPPDVFDKVANNPEEAQSFLKYWDIRLSLEPDGWTLWRGQERVSRLEVTATTKSEDEK